MPRDDEFIEDLVETAEDGKAGYEKGADQLEGGDHHDLATVFRRYSEQRDQFVTQLRGVENKYGEDNDASGSMAGKVHRGWLAVKDALTGSGPTSVLRTAIQGEDRAIERYEEILTKDLSDDLGSLVRLQLEEIRLARAAMVELDAAEQSD